MLRVKSVAFPAVDRPGFVAEEPFRLFPAKELGVVLLAPVILDKSGVLTPVDGEKLGEVEVLEPGITTDVELLGVGERPGVKLGLLSIPQGNGTGSG